MHFDEFTSMLKGVKKTPNGVVACCPAHEDRNASLSVGTGADGRIVLKCFSGCTAEAVVGAMGLKMEDLFPPKAPAPQKKRAVAGYEYFSKDGKPLIRVVRFEPKSFGRQSPDGKGGWQWGGTSTTAALYHWPELARALGDHPAVFLVEGEKDCDNVRRLGLISTTALGGASKWREEYGAEFVGAAVVYVICDNDDTGKKFGAAAAHCIRAAGIKVRCLTLPSEIAGRKVKDASDAIAAGWGAEDLRNYCESAVEVDMAAVVRGSDTSGGEGASLSAPARCETLAEAIETAKEIAYIERQKTKLSAEDRRAAIVEGAVEWLLAHGAFYYDVDTRDETGAYFFNKQLRELYQISGAMFQTWLAWAGQLSRVSVDFRWLHSHCEEVAMQSKESKRVTPSLFWESRNKAVYISNGDGEMVRITSRSVEKVDNGTDGVLFRSGRTCSPWKLLPGSESKPLWACRIIGGISTPENELAPLLLTLWILSLFFNLKNKPPLSLSGDIGSGKTRTATGIYEILGLEPRVLSVDKRDKGAEEFWVSQVYGGISTIDNVDSKCKWLPDAVAAAATGGVAEKRKLYTDNELSHLRAKSALMITSANPVYATDSGLADRLINVVFARPEERVSSDDEITREIIRDRDAFMSFIAHTISKALRVKDDPPDSLNKRHPDWAAVCWRCGCAMGFRDETEDALNQAEAGKAIMAVRSDIFFGAPMLRVFEQLGEAWEGDAGELAQLLKEGYGGRLVNSREILTAGRVTPIEYDERAKTFVTGFRVGGYIKSTKAHLNKVFNMSSRIIRGKTNFTFHPYRDSQSGGGGGVVGPFLTSLYKFYPFLLKEFKNEGETPPPPPPEGYVFEKNESSPIARPVQLNLQTANNYDDYERGVGGGSDDLPYDPDDDGDSGFDFS